MFVRHGNILIANGSNGRCSYRYNEENEVGISKRANRVSTESEYFIAAGRRSMTHNTGSEAFHGNPGSGNDCAGQGRRYPDNGHGTWSRTISVVLESVLAQKGARKNFEKRHVIFVP